MLSNAVKINETVNDQFVQNFLDQISSKSWFGQMEDLQAEKLLQGKQIGTYLFRLDSQGDIYLVGVNSEEKVEHVKIKKDNDMWIALDGGVYIRDNVQELIHLSLHCKESDCIPLRLDIV